MQKIKPCFDFNKICNIVLAVVLVFFLALFSTACSGGKNSSVSTANSSSKSATQNQFEYWNNDAESLTALKDYVTNVTNESSDSYIPQQDRIAVFDMDGTLYGELAPIYVEWCMYAYRVLQDPTYVCTDPEMIRIANEIVEAGKTRTLPETLESEHSYYAQKAFAGMSIEQYCDYVNEFLTHPVEGFSNATYADMWYLPMKNVVDYLNDNGFTVYAVSGTDRLMVRTMLQNGCIGIDENHVIGMDCKFCVAGKEGQDMSEYQLTPNDKIVRTDELLVKNVKMNKAALIAREIGKKPVLAFGNSTGDISMATLVSTENPYKSAVFMVVADDTQRDYGNTQKANSLSSKWQQNGWTCISMKNDFALIYDPKVIKQNS